MIKVEEREEFTPICPHCNAELQKVISTKVESTFGKRYVYACSECKKVLGLTQRKGFWMG